MTRIRTALTLLAFALCPLGFTPGLLAQTRPADERKAQPASLPPELERDVNAAIGRGLAFLKAAQDERGGWTAAYGPAVTAIVAQAFVQSPEYGPQHAAVRRAVAYVLTFVQPDGGIYQPEQNLGNYQTSVALMMLASLDDPAHKERVAAAQRFLAKLQYDEPESVDAGNPWYGGSGYKENKRPDLSNTQMMLEALHQSGLPASDPTYQKALKFISRCQMSSETNDQPFARGGPGDGGFIYSPANGGESKAETEVVEGRTRLRSYGSMTYAGFKSMLYANVDRQDTRVRAALEWIRRHWTLDSNPNMPGERSHEGLYYYYHVFARAMRAWGQPVITDERDVPHHWRIELCRKLLSLQNRDGSWVNTKDRWLEGDPNYITALSVLTLQEAVDKQ